MKRKTKGGLLELCRLRVKESLNLELKASAKFQDPRKEWVKEIAGFATAAGGTLIFGIEEDRTTREALRLDGGLSHDQCSAEQMADQIDGNVQPKVEGIWITPVKLAPQHFAYVIEVPASDRAPHMWNGRYYMRRAFKSEPMEDYLVRAVMFRQRSPVLRLRWWRETPNPETTFLRFALQNEGRVGAEDVYFEVAISEGALHAQTTFPENPPYFQVRRAKMAGDDFRTFSCTQTHASSRGGNIGHRLPLLIYPEMDIEVKDFVIGLKSRIGPGAVMRTRLFARNMEMVETEESLTNVTEPEKG